MKKILMYTKTKLVFLLAVVLATIVGGATTAFVLAAIPDSKGQINACYKNNTQVLRVTDPAGNCANNETALSWRQQGSNNVLSNRVFFPYDSGTNQLVLNVPGYGKFEVTNCSSINPNNNASWNFTNTSGQLLEYSSDSMAFQYLNNNDQVTDGGHATFTLGKGDGTGSAVVFGNIAAQEDGSSGCIYQISVVTP